MVKKKSIECQPSALTDLFSAGFVLTRKLSPIMGGTVDSADTHHNDQSDSMTPSVCLTVELCGAKGLIRHLSHQGNFHMDFKCARSSAENSIPWVNRTV